MKKGHDPSENQKLIDDWALQSKRKKTAAEEKKAETGPNGEVAAEPEGNPEEPEQPAPEGDSPEQKP